MPSQFRSFNSSLEPDTPQLNGEPSTNGTSLLDRIKKMVSRGSTEPMETTETAAQPSDDDGAASWLHEIIKSTDFWFNYELSLLEKYAITEAVESAKAGIPRQDAPLERELPIETTLKARASEIFQEWIARVKRKVQDSVQAACAEAGDKIVQFRHVFGQLERSTVEIETTQSSINDREEALRNQQKTFGAPALMNRRLYFLLLGCLALIDWIANVPIFTELLPAEYGSREIWRQLALSAEKAGALGGVRMLGERLLFHLDVSIFALGVVAFLMVMAHFAGEALRRWFVFNPADEPLLAPTLRANRRQTYLPMCLALFGIFLAVSFLYGSRSRLVEATNAGLTRAQQDVDGATKRVSEAKSSQGDLSRLPELQQQLNEAKSKRDDWRERERFATDIGTMNTPILLLNIVLALTALTAAYFAAEPKVTEGRLVDPMLPELKSRLASLRLDVVNQRQSLRTLDAEIQTSISRAKYLASTRPLAEWEAKAERLNSVVPQFRWGNACARGVDPESIIAFKQPSVVDFPAVPTEGFQPPVELAVLEDEFKKLRSELQRHTLDPRQSISVGTGV